MFNSLALAGTMSVKAVPASASIECIIVMQIEVGA